MKFCPPRFFYSFLLLCGTLASYGQTKVGINSESVRWGSKIARASDVNSNFLFSKDFLLADITLENGKVIIGNKVRLNLQQNRLYYMLSPEEELEVSMQLKQIVFGVQEGNKTEAVFAAGFPPVGDLTKENFYQVIAAGKASLLLDIKFTEISRVQMPIGPVTETTKLENYYGSNGTVTIKISKPEDLAALMADKSTEVMEFIQKEKIKVKKQADLLKVFNYYNGLVK